jgi:hypothetical protein
VRLATFPESLRSFQCRREVSGGAANVTVPPQSSPRPRKELRSFCKHFGWPITLSI